MKMPEAVFEQQDEYELPISMVDVVFLLLVFFMCATTFRRAEQSLACNLPRTGSPPDPEVVPPPTLRLYIRESGRMLLNQTLLDGAEDLYHRLADIRLVRPRASILYVVRAYDTALRAGVSDIRFQAPVKARPAREYF